MKIILSIDGMHCGGCQRAITGVLSQVEHVVSVDVNLGDGNALIEAKNGIDVAELVAAVEDAGYQARLDRSGE